MLLDVDSGMINSYQYEMKEKRRKRRMKVLVIGGGAAGLMAAGAAPVSYTHLTLPTTPYV